MAKITTLERHLTVMGKDMGESFTEFCSGVSYYRLDFSFLLNYLVMRVNRLVLIVLLLGCIGVGILYITDPTRTIPTVKFQITLKPGENITFGIPKDNGWKWLAQAAGDPFLFIETDAKDFAVKGLQKLIPGGILGFPPFFDDPDSDSDDVVIVNDGNETVTGTIGGSRAPAPDQWGNMGGFRIIAFGIFEMVIATIVSCLKPAPTVNVRQPAQGSIGQLTGNIVTDPCCGKMRGVMTRCLQSCCMRNSV